MSIKSIIETVKKFFQETLQEKCRVITVIKDEDKWKAVCEVLVDLEYTTKRGLGDIVEIYEVYLNEKEEILSYELTATKKKASLSE